jgi:hypothetical protein
MGTLLHWRSIYESALALRITDPRSISKFGLSSLLCFLCDLLLNPVTTSVPGVVEFYPGSARVSP